MVYTREMVKANSKRHLTLKLHGIDLNAQLLFIRRLRSEVEMLRKQKLLN